ncbi:prepilin peptidase [Arthrobacter sp. CAU 1506]|uniref:prepilin peptidase n=1 Tax=Arthrobacter sp. CAU 1506 TaxID=2560052 RepID=UPI0010ACC73C|nr:A24 family peptidase [Arthrobacter sp. CAU 1506]TJY71515.1 prepilin peptidase [Arthrobacter sp. CAU 1506]
MDPISLQIAFAAGSAIIAFIGAWIAFPLAQCEERTSLPPQWRITTAVLAAAAGALLGWAFGGSWALPAYLLLAVAGALLAAIDIRHHLLPNRLIGPFLAGAVVLLLLATLATGSWTRLFLGLAGGLSLFAIYLVLALIKPGGIGMGDVKLAGVIGLYAGYLGISAWAYVLLGAFLLNVFAAIVLLLLRKISLRSETAFGPSMVAAAVLAPLLT